MKALIISDDKEIIETFESYLSKKNVETITYSWFLKALDNIEEIKPDMLIINGEEYPRHWKILSQFAKSNIMGKKIPVFVYYAMDMNEDEENKIKTLKNTILLDSLKDELLTKLTEQYDLTGIEDAAVDTICDSIDESSVVISEIDENEEDEIITVDSLTSDIIPEDSSDADSQMDSLIENKQIVLRALINSNVNKKIVIGNIIFNSFEDMKIKFVPDYSEDLDLFTTDSNVHDAFYEYEKDCIHFNAKVLNVRKDDDSCVDMEFLE